MKIYIKILIASILANVMLPLLCYAYGDHIEMGDSILFGETLHESMHGIVYGSAPIEWTVLEKENNLALLISKCAIKCEPYDGETWENRVIKEHRTKIMSKHANFAERT